LPPLYGAAFYYLLDVWAVHKFQVGSLCGKDIAVSFVICPRHLPFAFLSAGVGRAIPHFLACFTYYNVSRSLIGWAGQGSGAKTWAADRQTCLFRMLHCARAIARCHYQQTLAEARSRRRLLAERIAGALTTPGWTPNSKQQEEGRNQVALPGALPEEAQRHSAPPRREGADDASAVHHCACADQARTFARSPPAAQETHRQCDIMT